METNQTNNASVNSEAVPPKEKNIGMAILAYILFFVPLLTNAKKDPFVKYHVKQGLVLFIINVIAAVVARISIIDWFSWLINLAILILFIIGILNAANGREKPLPFVGHFADNFKF